MVTLTFLSVFGNKAFKESKVRSLYSKIKFDTMKLQLWELKTSFAVKKTPAFMQTKLQNGSNLWFLISETLTLTTTVPQLESV